MYSTALPPQRRSNVSGQYCKIFTINVSKTTIDLAPLSEILRIIAVIYKILNISNYVQQSVPRKKKQFITESHTISHIFGCEFFLFLFISNEKVKRLDFASIKFECKMCMVWLNGLTGALSMHSSVDRCAPTVTECEICVKKSTKSKLKCLMLMSGNSV